MNIHGNICHVRMRSTLYHSYTQQWRQPSCIRGSLNQRTDSMSEVASPAHRGSQVLSGCTHFSARTDRQSDPHPVRRQKKGNAALHGAAEHQCETGGQVRYQIKELKHVDVAETLLCLDLFGAADILIFGVPAGCNNCAFGHQLKWDKVVQTRVEDRVCRTHL